MSTQGGENMEKQYTTADRLRYLMEKRSLKQTDILAASKPFCKKYDIKLSKSDLSQFVSGKVKPGQEKMTILALTLNVSEAWLLGLDVPMERQQELSSNVTAVEFFQKIPLVGQIACGTPILAEENITDYVDVPGHIRADYALTCKGDSMINAGIRDGDIVYIRQQAQVENGQIAAVMVGQDEATLKRVYMENGVVTLNAENSAYTPKVFVGEEANQIHVLGLAVAFLHHLV